MVPPMPDAAVVFLTVSASISLALLVLGARAYYRTRDPAMGFVTGAFALFFSKNVLVVYSLASGIIGHETLEVIDAAGDLGTVFLLLAPIFWPRR